MPTRQLSWIVLFCAVAPGCSIAKETTHNLFVRPVSYCFYKDNHATDVRARELARQAWQEMDNGGGPGGFSNDYAKGFEDGFAEFLDFGGSGTPPPVPPRSYWKIEYQTPQGHQAIEDWYAGYAQGSGAAQESGLRRLFVVPAGEPYVADRIALLRERRYYGVSSKPPPEKLVTPPKPVPTVTPSMPSGRTATETKAVRPDVPPASPDKG